MYLPMDQVFSNAVVGYPAYGSTSSLPNLINGIHGNALSFNGIDHYVDLGLHDNECMGNPELCPNGFTWAMWLKIEPNNAVDNKFILSSSDGWGTSTKGVSIRINSNDEISFHIVLQANELKHLLQTSLSVSGSI